LFRNSWSESYENLDRLDRDLVGLEKNPQDQDALAGVFRTIHTIKGTCGFFGFNKLEKVAHVGENLLTRLRDRQLTLNSEITRALLGMVDAVRQMLKAIESTGQDGDSEYLELRDTLTRLQTPVARVDVVALAPPARVEVKPPSTPPHLSPPELAVDAAPAPTAAPVTRPVDLPAEPRKKDAKARRPSRGKIGGSPVERGFAGPSDIALDLEDHDRRDRRQAGMDGYISKPIRF
jgi:two-component system, chemotaxis family, sensor kinase CheA